MPKVLVASDGSAFAIEAARRGVALLEPGAALTVVVVVPAISPIAGLATERGLRAADLDPFDNEQANAHAKSDLDATVALLGRAAVGRVEHGDPGTTLCDVAGREAFDLIVIGSHGSGVIKRALLGSVSHHVLHHAPCPVLVVRHIEEPDTPVP
ncbi:MAG TPA: universal stress protein [Acidimicrobiales bacterium]|nr:universal stress protein [Acidimicrobiales bacterium]